MPAAADLRATFDHRHPRSLAHLVVAELAAGVELDQDRARVVLGVDDHRGGRRELRQVPGAHSRTVSRQGCRSTLGRRMPLAVEQLELGPLGTNCYLVRADRAASEAVVVDPSGSAAEIRLRLAQLGARCAAILVTHGHWDHLLGVADLAEGTGVDVTMPEGERALLENAGGFTPAGVAIRSWTPERTVGGGETLAAAGIAFEVLAVPGHSPAHVAYAADGCLFSGDLLFAGSVGRTDLPGGDWDTLLDSVRMLSERFPPDTVVYPGHGPVTTLGAELERNPFLADLRAEPAAE